MLNTGKIPYALEKIVCFAVTWCTINMLKLILFNLVILMVFFLVILCMDLSIFRYVNIVLVEIIISTSLEGSLSLFMKIIVMSFDTLISLLGICRNI